MNVSLVPPNRLHPASYVLATRNSVIFFLCFRTVRGSTRAFVVNLTSLPSPHIPVGNVESEENIGQIFPTTCFSRMAQRYHKPEYVAPDHTSGIPVIKEQAKASHAKEYVAPDHTSGIPVVKEQPKGHKEEYHAPDHTTGIPVVKEQPRGHKEEYHAPDHTTGIPVVKVEARTQGLKKYVPPDHTAGIPVVKTKPDYIDDPTFTEADY